MRRILLAILATTLPQSVIAGASEPEATEQAKVDARAAHNACLINNAAKYDDGKSDASTIGQALSDSCTDTLLDVAAVYSQGLNARIKRYTRQRFLEAGPNMATSIVLRLRAGG
jgi:hypothetical protein